MMEDPGCFLCTQSDLLLGVGGLCQTWGTLISKAGRVAPVIEFVAQSQKIIKLQNKRKTVCSHCRDEESWSGKLIKTCRLSPKVLFPKRLRIYLPPVTLSLFPLLLLILHFFLQSPPDLPQRYLLLIGGI